jgi:hypothetical protein
VYGLYRHGYPLPLLPRTMMAQSFFYTGDLPLLAYTPGVTPHPFAAARLQCQACKCYFESNMYQLGNKTLTSVTQTVTLAVEATQKRSSSTEVLKRSTLNL